MFYVLDIFNKESTTLYLSVDDCICRESDENNTK